MFSVIFNRPNADFMPIRTRDQISNVVVVPAPYLVFKAVQKESEPLPTPRKLLKPLSPRRR